MSTEVERARTIVQAEQEIAAAVAIINKAALRLNSIGYDTKVSGWDWDRAGSSTAISCQGNLAARVVATSERPKR